VFHAGRGQQPAHRQAGLAGSDDDDGDAGHDVTRPARR
jgi:hypothetical protein